MVPANTLSRAPIANVHSCDLMLELEEVDQTAIANAIPVAQLQQIQDTSSADPVMKILREAGQKGWPATKSEISESLYPYYDIRDELTVQDNLIFKRQQLVIPAMLRREMMSRAHASQIAIDGCKLVKVGYY